MGGRRNELRNAADLIGLFFRHEFLKYTKFKKFLKYRTICSRTRSEDQILYSIVQSILVLLHFELTPPHFIRFEDGTDLTIIKTSFITSYYLKVRQYQTLFGRRYDALLSLRFKNILSLLKELKCGNWKLYLCW